MREVTNIDQFNEWAIEKNIPTINEVDGFKVGDNVTFINDYGVSFPNHTIIGISEKPESWGGQIYLDIDSYWHPVSPNQLKLTSSQNKSLTQEIHDIIAKTLPGFNIEVKRKPYVVRKDAEYIAIMISTAGKYPENEIVSLMLDPNTWDLKEQMFGGMGGQYFYLKTDPDNPKQSNLVYSRAKVSFRTPAKNKEAVLSAIAKFALNYKKALTENRKFLLDNPDADYNKLLGVSASKGASLHKYKLGDKYRSDFDYDGMLEVARTANIDWGIEKLSKLSESLTDVNYHSENKFLWNAIEYLKRGKKEDAKEEMAKFKEAVEEYFSQQNNYVDDVLADYVQALLWTEVDENEDPLENNYNFYDFDQESIDSMRGDIEEFVSLYGTQIDESGMTEQQLGHDLWLTRNHHGAGFWDRGYDKKVSDVLVKGAHDLGESYVEVGDDGKLRVRPLRQKMKQGGVSNFDKGVKKIEKKLVGTRVPEKYKKDYGKTYNPEEAHVAATRIKGSIRAKEILNKINKKK